jgi:hypothetical protein
MRYLTSTITAIALAGTVSVFAQEQAPAPAPAQAQAPKATLTGCVVQAKTTDGGTAFVLTKVTGGSAPIYILGGSVQSDWSTNLNKKVEVTGQVQEAPPADKEGAADPKVIRPGAIAVETVKVVAETCA